MLTIHGSSVAHGDAKDYRLFFFSSVIENEFGIEIAM